jgi:outer membrane lipoprotein-sorting protein
MKHAITRITFLAAISILMAGVAKAQPTGREIMLKVDERPNGDTRLSVMTMELVNKRGSKRVRSMQSYAKDEGKDSKSIMFFQEPADVKGTGFLTWDYNDEDKDDDRWLYLPAMKKTRRISGSSAKKEYFMGSDFTYDDMGNRDVDSDEHVLLREETVNGHPCYVVQSTPKDDDGLYSRTEGWIDKEHYVAHKILFYDAMGSLMKELHVEEMEQIGGIWTVTRMRMQNHQRNHSTVIYIESMEYDRPMDNSMFTVNALEKGYIQ